MRINIAILTTLACSTVAAAPITGIVCSETKMVQVEPATLKVHEYDSNTVYRFHDGNLYLKSGNDPEYLYNTVSETEPDRYSSGHKTIFFATSASGRTVAHLTHVYRDEVRISIAACHPNSK